MLASGTAFLTPPAQGCQLFLFRHPPFGKVRQNATVERPSAPIRRGGRQESTICGRGLAHQPQRKARPQRPQRSWEAGCPLASHLRRKNSTESSARGPRGQSWRCVREIGGFWRINRRAEGDQGGSPKEAQRTGIGGNWEEGTEARRHRAGGETSHRLQGWTRIYFVG